MNVHLFGSLLELLEGIMFSILRDLDVEGWVNQTSVCEKDVSCKCIVCQPQAQCTF